MYSKSMIIPLLRRRRCAEYSVRSRDPVTFTRSSTWRLWPGIVLQDLGVIPKSSTFLSCSLISPGHTHAAMNTIKEVFQRKKEQVRWMNSHVLPCILTFGVGPADAGHLRHGWVSFT
jgi:hypothetical protein